MGSAPQAHRPPAARPVDAGLAAFSPRFRFGVLTAGVFFLALGVRLVYLEQIRPIPFFEWLVGDAAAYDAWAHDIARGNWLGQETFYQAPGYPYFLAAVYKLLLREFYAVRVVQSVVGATACVLLTIASRRYFGRGVGLLAGVMLAIYPPAIFFDGLIQKACLDLLLMTALAWSWSHLAARPPWWRWLICGTLLGLLGLTRENALVLTVAVLGWIWLAFRKGLPPPRVGWSAALLAGLTLVLLPVAVRNWHVGGEFVITTVQAGPNFYIGNHAGATGRYTPLVRGHETPEFERHDARRLAEQAAGRPLTGREVSRYWIGQAGDFITTQPGAWLRLLGKKALLTINAYEINDLEGYNLYCDFAPLLYVLNSVWHFGVLAPLAAAGVVLTWAQRRRLGLLYAAILLLAGSTVLFYVFARYRYPLVPLLMIFAAAGMVEGIAAWRARRLRILGKALGALLMAGFVCNLPVNPEKQLNAMAYANLGTLLASSGRTEAGQRLLQIAVEELPQSAEIHFNLARTCHSDRNLPAALAHYRKALELDPGLPGVDVELGWVLEGMGDLPGAIGCYQAALEKEPGNRIAQQRLSQLVREPGAPGGSTLDN